MGAMQTMTIRGRDLRVGDVISDLWFLHGPGMVTDIVPYNGPIPGPAVIAYFAEQSSLGMTVFLDDFLSVWRMRALLHLPPIGRWGEEPVKAALRPMPTAALRQLARWAGDLLRERESSALHVAPLGQRRIA